MIDYDALLERLEVFGLGTIGKNITFDTMPETVTKGVCIRSRISGNVIDYEIPKRLKSSIVLKTSGRCA